MNNYVFIYSPLSLLVPVVLGILMGIYLECGANHNTTEPMQPEGASYLPAYDGTEEVLPDEGLVYIRIIHKIDGLPKWFLVESMGDTPLFKGIYYPHPQTEKVIWKLPHGKYAITRVFYEELWNPNIKQLAPGDLFIPNQFTVQAQSAGYIGDLIFMDDRPPSLSRTDPVQALEIIIQLEDRYDQALDEYQRSYTELDSDFPLKWSLMAMSQDNVLRLTFHNELPEQPESIIELEEWNSEFPDQTINPWDQDMNSDKEPGEESPAYWFPVMEAHEYR
jgi:hypothetical protein